MSLIFRRLIGFAAFLLSYSGLEASAQSFTINPIFSTGCSNCYYQGSQVSLSTIPGAEAAVTATDKQISSQFGGSTTVNIAYIGIHAGNDPNGLIASNNGAGTVYSYSQYVNALAADAALHPQNTVLNTAVANLGFGNGAGDPNAMVYVSTPSARNLGLTYGVTTAYGPSDQTPEYDSNGNYVGPDNGGTADGVVFLNVDQPLSYTRPIQSFTTGVAYDAESALEHETDEVLGIGGGGSQLNYANYDPNYASDYFGVTGALYGQMDLYRYSAPGTPSFDSTGSYLTYCNEAPFCTGQASPYFSVDGGVTSIDEFNQLFPSPDFGGDAGDWGLSIFAPCVGGGYGGLGNVQDAFNCSNISPDVKPGSPEYLALEAIGFNAVPEPATWALMFVGLGIVGRLLRRRSVRVASGDPPASAQLRESEISTMSASLADGGRGRNHLCVGASLLAGIQLE